MRIILRIAFKCVLLAALSLATLFILYLFALFVLTKLDAEKIDACEKRGGKWTSIDRKCET